ncbi:hypothetical protein IMG5_183060 [Ichthyophthirius multifiliis]|uniref:Uncharacterized protein n=1 Tax=Ichthyophthirius multifiliis TaxID=5932 RepID=G0R344_ICHMU|nr:hypothetical protein IMG5_183060 [Ichthyophthirius multifiliis]EGR28120.1 hypothetical protein IMG5_183060 [Ichthyophthirius multifiliis]|eukprot:XP_004027465.1 hypothetical protein IMG5_183060 [Ichthyophthirius multifiliis]
MDSFEENTNEYTHQKSGEVYVKYLDSVLIPSEQQNNDTFIEQQEQETKEDNDLELELEKSYTKTECEIQLNFYTKCDQLRNKYINKLINNKILKQNQTSKHQTIIIFDWDDTLFCTTSLQAQKFDYISQQQSKNIFNLDISAVKNLLLKICWVEYSSKIFMPNVFNFITESKIQIISARTKYESQFPSQSHLWKIFSFKDLRKNYDKQIITNLICLGDSLIEINAANILSKEFDIVFLKTIKFKEAPKIDELAKQLDLIKYKLDQIYKDFKNITIRLEKYIILFSYNLYLYYLLINLFNQKKKKKKKAVNLMINLAFLYIFYKKVKNIICEKKKKKKVY